ncbi:hypothetical protein BZA77DRAFT_353414 [Pyronema omphalodes]|nr:hypothetical protein BZA77DRAFT_353414 [Pyronema omphalodes]
MIDRLEGEERVYFGVDEIKEDKEHIQSDALPEYLSLLRSPGIPRSLTGAIPAIGVKLLRMQLRK